ncbi:MAG TPA: hypothetical protein DHW82_14220 [Spirochaetia bacterium]|nr:MAG: hypothetical protein A2Y41_00360 [Spirochaetes bacterium GWB1_36_13]HCL58146.1 hypothetical protein [Spirochaetia bacterium]
MRKLFFVFLFFVFGCGTSETVRIKKMSLSDENQKTLSEAFSEVLKYEKQLVDYENQTENTIIDLNLSDSKDETVLPHFREKIMIDKLYLEIFFKKDRAKTYLIELQDVMIKTFLTDGEGE